MFRKSSVLAMVGLAAGLLMSASARAEKPPVPDEAKGYIGTLEGAVKEKAPANGWISVTVTKATPDRKSKVKDGSVLVGKDIPVSCRLAGNDPFPKQKAYFGTLKAGDQVNLTVFYNDHGESTAIRLKEVPAGSTTKPAAN
jgi:hypothetical protein